MIAAIPFAWGPLLGAALTVRLLGESVRDWIEQVRDWRVGAGWYVLGLSIVVIGTDARTLLALAAGADVGVQAGRTMPISAYLLNFLLTLLVAGALEEFGWRGFAQARFQERDSATLGAVVIGVLWAGWHLPLAVLLDLGSFADPVDYLAIQVAKSIVLAWLYNETGGALLVAMVVHAAGNMPGFLTVTGETPLVAEQLPVTPLYYCVVAAIVVLYAGHRTLTRDGSLPAVPGRVTDSDVRSRRWRD